ncbi:hypothetical protein TH2_08486 [Thalassospira profundimaris WP0211]|nr:hypothetical protein TH2_08486 [Thalassospira profundimaris WP0211]
MISYRNIDKPQNPRASSFRAERSADPESTAVRMAGDSRLRGNDDLQKGVVPFLLLSFEACLEVRARFFLLSIEFPCLKQGKPYHMA